MIFSKKAVPAPNFGAGTAFFNHTERASFGDGERQSFSTIGSPVYLIRFTDSPNEKFGIAAIRLLHWKPRF